MCSETEDKIYQSDLYYIEAIKSQFFLQSLKLNFVVVIVF